MAELADGTPSSAGSRAFVAQASERIAAGDLEGGLRIYSDAVNGAGSWDSLPAAERQIRHDNAYTLLAQINEGRQPYSKDDAEALKLPTLFVIGGDTPGRMPLISKALAAHVSGSQTVVIPEATHAMFRQQPAAFCKAVLEFLAE